MPEVRMQAVHHLTRVGHTSGVRHLFPWHKNQPHPVTKRIRCHDGRPEDSPNCCKHAESSTM
jgi:hypothetical protein